MVNTRRLGNALFPYENHDTELDLEESELAIDNFFQKEDFVQSDAIVYHGGPSKEEDEARFNVLEDAAHLLYSNQNNPDIYMPEDQLHRAEDSDIINEKVVETFDPEITEDDINMTLGPHYEGDLVAVTSDYHMDRVERLYNERVDGDYLVLGAKSADHQIAIVEKQVGKFEVEVPVRSWMAELNEANHKRKGSRF